MHFFSNTADLDLRGGVCLCTCEEGTEGEQEPGCKSRPVRSSDELGLENLPTFQYAGQIECQGVCINPTFLTCCSFVVTQ